MQLYNFLMTNVEIAVDHHGPCMQCAVSLLKAEIYRNTNIPPEYQRIKFKVSSLNFCSPRKTSPC